MNICLIQHSSNKGDVAKNIENHITLMKSADPRHVDLFVFPELSITGYEPTIAQALVTSIENPIYNSLQHFADKYDTAISIGAPTIGVDGHHISMIIFSPHQKRKIYSKQILHKDELPYFTHGTQPNILTIKGTRIALGICYETLQKSHFEKSIKNNADIYIASVAKSQDGITKALDHFPTLAHKYKTPICMVNSIGTNDNFISAGQSAVWNSFGKKLCILGSDKQGWINFDTQRSTVKIKNL